MVEEDKNMRLFIGIELSEEIKGAFVNYQNILKKDGSIGNYSRKENLHLTLFFIGEVSVDELFLWERILTDTAKQNTAFALEFKGVDSFVRNKRHIVYAEVKKQKNLLFLWETLLKEIRKRGINPQVSDYTPHITLVREAEFIRSFDQIKKGFPELKLTSVVNDIILFESTRVDGVLTYVPLKRAKLNS